MRSPVSSLTIQVVQHVDGDDRRAALAAAVRQASGGTDLVVLPYLGAAPPFWTRQDRAGYSYAERPPARTVDVVRQTARERAVAAAVSCYEVVAEGVFYASVTLIGADGEIVGTYRQAHAVNRPGWHEQLFFQPGTTGGFPIFTVGSARLGFLLGGDLWVPEAARLLALGGADVIVAIAGLPMTPFREANAIARVRAIENGNVVVLANRLGDGVLVGMSQIYDPEGELIESVEMGQPFGVARIDVKRLAIQRQRGQALNLRRPRLYGSLASGEEGALP